MPQINKDKCFKILEDTASESGSIGSLNIDELSDVLLSLSNEAVVELKGKLNEKIGSASTYTYKKEVSDSLNIILIQLKGDKLSDSDKRLIADKLLEGINHCAAGFHDRVNQSLMNLTRPQSIDAFLGQMRQGIVEAAARSAGGEEVHLHNSFFSAAFTLGYGVKPINLDDVYSQALIESEVKVIKQAFESRYTPFNILDSLRENIEGELRAYYEYQGDNPDGYSCSIYKKIGAYFKILLGSNLEEEQFFIVGKVFDLELDFENDVIRDINWLLVQDCLWKKLADEGYINFTNEEKVLLQALYYDPKGSMVSLAEMSEGAGAASGRGVTNLDEILKDPSYKDLLFSLNLICYPQMLKPLLLNQKKLLIDIYIEYAVQLSFEGLKAYKNIICSFFTDDVDLANVYIKKLYSQWIDKQQDFRLIREKILDVAQNQSELFPAFFDIIKNLEAPKKHAILIDSNIMAVNDVMWAVRYQPNIILELVDMAPTLSAAQRLAILTAIGSDSRNLLMLGLRYESSAIESLIHLISQLPEDKKRSVLTEEDMQEYNALMLAARFHPSAIPALLEVIATFPKVDQRQAMLTAKNLDGYNALMLAARYQASAIPALLEMIATFPDADQRLAMLTAKNSEGYNALMLAARYQASAIPALLKMIATFPEADQRRAILTAIDRDGDNILNLAVRYQPMAIPELLKMPFSIVSAFCRGASNRLIAEHKERAIEDAISSLDETSLLQRELKIKLRRMQYQATDKREAIVIALDDIKQTLHPLSMSNRAYFDSVIRGALNNPESQLYKACNFRRYGGGFSLIWREADTLRRMRQTVQNMRAAP